MTRSVIVSTVRTPFGRLGGGLAGHSATELGSIAIRAGLERAGIEATEVGYVVMGQVLQAGVGQAPARQAAVGAGIPKEVPADTINKVCASSIRAIELADLMIRAGRHDVVVTGGMESMSNAPYLLPKARFGYRLGNGEVIDHMVFDGLTSTFDGDHMVVQASRVARELEISRESQDAWAARSQSRAAAAQDAGVFAEEIVPVGDFAADEGIRRDTTLEKLATLKPVFDPEGTTTAGNAPGVNDGASCRRRVLRGVRSLARPRGAGHDRRVRSDRRRLRLPRADACEGRGARARARRTDDGRRVPRRDQRGIRVGGEQLDAHARSRRGDRQRQRRCDRPRAPDRASGGRIVGDARERAPALRRRARPGSDLLGRRAGRRPLGRGLIRAALIVVLAALAFSGAAQAYSCPTTPIETRIEGAGAVFVGRSTGFIPIAGAGVPQRLYHFKIDQEVKGDLGSTVSVRVPVKPENGGQEIPEDTAAGILMNRANGTWFTTRCGITDPGVVLAGVDKPKGNAIRLLIGFVILGAVLLYSIRKVRRREPPSVRPHV
jgi:hypothetical protein